MLISLFHYLVQEVNEIHFLRSLFIALLREQILLTCYIKWRNGKHLINIILWEKRPFSKTMSHITEYTIGNHYVTIISIVRQIIIIIHFAYMHIQDIIIFSNHVTNHVTKYHKQKKSISMTFVLQLFTD